FLDQLLAHTEAADEMGRNPDRLQLHHQIFGNPVVEHTLSFENGALFRVKGGGVVLEILHERAGLRSFVQDFGFALVNRASPFHGNPIFRQRGSRARDKATSRGNGNGRRKRSAPPRRNLAMESSWGNPRSAPCTSSQMS